MSAKTAKIYRKEARKVAEQEIQVLHRLMRPRPWYIPRFLWVWLAGLFFYTK